MAGENGEFHRPHKAMEDSIDSGDEPPTSS